MTLEEILKIDKFEIIDDLIAFPTDTVYGVGALINDEVGIDKIYELKQRNYHKPLAILVGSISDALALLDSPSPKIKELMNSYWPGALTIIGKKSRIVPPFLNKDFLTIGIRMPDCDVARAILKKFGPMAVTSVNLSGTAPLNSANEIKEHFGDKIKYLVEENVKSSNKSSTIVEINNDELTILRQGDIVIK